LVGCAGTIVYFVHQLGAFKGVTVAIRVMVSTIIFNVMPLMRIADEEDKANEAKESAD